jgi:hypothetical protein
MIMYEAKKPYSFFDTESGQEVRTEPHNCIRLVVDKYSISDPSIPALFKKGEKAANASENAEQNQAKVDQYKEEIVKFCAKALLPIPDKIEYVIDKKHARGNNFLLIYKEAREAMLLRNRWVELEGCLFRLHAVINRRKKLTMAGGLSGPSLATAKQASEVAKQLTEHTLGWQVDALTPSFYNCNLAGQHVLSDKSIRLKKLPEGVTAGELKVWFSEEAGVTPTQVYQDNVGRNRSTRKGLVALPSLQGRAAAVMMHTGMWKLL